MPKITRAEVRMYRLGTGDCFAIKLFAKDKVSFKMMIDAGAWSGDEDHLNPYINNLKEYLGDYADVLVVTHEHKDHVHAFDICRKLFTDGHFNVGEIWLGWTENDKVQKVIDWKKEYGEKKKALGMASTKLREVIDSPEFIRQFSEERDGPKMIKARQNFSQVLDGFAELHLSKEEQVYKGGLKGMEVVKNDIVKKEVKYFKPGDIIRDIKEAVGIKFYVLGPPELYDDVKEESGDPGDSYQHNKILRESEAFGAAALNLNNSGLVPSYLLPFDEQYFESDDKPNNSTPSKEENELAALKTIYQTNDWRKIDFDWLFSSGSFALRMNGLTNNLSLALAIEFEGSGKVMLFPGDAEFGSWASWHKIDWREDDRQNMDKHLTEDLLNRTVFYKVAHHLSHNGTAQKLGLEMMNNKDLVAMATLDYNVINSGWTSTMPNRAIVKELLQKTKGRLIIMNEDKLFFDFNQKVPMSTKIEDARNRMTVKELEEFKKNLDVKNPLYYQFTIDGNNK